MKKLFAAVAGTAMMAAPVGFASIGFNSTALAAELPTKAPAVPVVPAPGDVPGVSWTFNATSEFKYYSWGSSLTTPGTGSAGSEYYTPVTLQMSGRVGNSLAIDLVGRGGWVNINQHSDDVSGVASTVTDSSLSANFTYLGITGFQPFIGLQTNIPTGQFAPNTLLDTDLVESPSFGQGFDIGGTAGFNLLPSSEWFLTTSVSYLARGSFSRTNGVVTLVSPAILTPADTISLKPGDLATLSQSVTYTNGGFSSRLGASASMESATFQDGLAIMKPGNSYSLSSDTNYNWSPAAGTTTLSASATHVDATETLGAINPAIRQTVANTATNVYSVTLQHLVPVGDFMVGPTGSYLFRDNNGINSAKLEFVPTKQRYSAGLIARYNATPNLTFNARVDGVWTHLDADLDIDGMRLTAIAGPYLPLSGKPAIDGTALWTTIGLNYRL